MSGRKPDPERQEEAAQWLAKAVEDAAVSHLLAREAYASPAAFHAQQAVEKVLKASLVAAGQDIRRTHDLDTLATQARQYWPALSPIPLTLVELNRWYSSSRYPGIDDDTPSLTTIAGILREIEQLIAAVKALIAS